ncbi:MAG: hypothetical protein IH944_06040 [Armatimonadetes bacterium]|nr:hypothetical protein [Armatimonadota bacterium]
MSSRVIFAALFLVCYAAGQVGQAQTEQAKLEDKDGRFALFATEWLAEGLPTERITFTAIPARGWFKDQGLTFSAGHLDGVIVRGSDGEMRLQDVDARENVRFDIESVDRDGRKSKSTMLSEWMTLSDDGETAVVTFKEPFKYKMVSEIEFGHREIDLRGPSGTFVLPSLTAESTDAIPLRSAQVPGPVTVRITTTRREDDKPEEVQIYNMTAQSMTYDSKTRTLTFKGDVVTTIVTTTADSEGDPITFRNDFVAITFDENGEIANWSSGAGEAKIGGGE